MASRTEQRAIEAIARIKEQVPAANLQFLSFDLTRLTSALSAAESFQQREERLDLLINNAGIVSLNLQSQGHAQY